MDLIGYANIEIAKDTRRYTFSMPLGSPFTECHEVAIEVANRIVELAQQEEARIAALKEQQDQVLPELANAEIVGLDAVTPEVVEPEVSAPEVDSVGTMEYIESVVVDAIDAAETVVDNIESAIGKLISEDTQVQEVE